MPQSNVTWVQYRPSAVCWLSLFLVFLQVGTSVSLPPQKLTFPNSNLIKILDLQVHENQLGLEWFSL